jgi:hypothetical protein
VIGIRAYQWGWEYFYPKNIDLNYNLKPSYSLITGNSLKYSNSSSLNLKTNTLWKYYQNKNTSSATITPAHLVLAPNDKSNILNFMNFNNIGVSTVKDSTAFKKIQYFSKTNTDSLYNIKSDFEANYYRLSTLYNTDLSLAAAHTYGLYRQHNYNSVLSNPKSTELNLDQGGIDKFWEYNLGVNPRANEPFNDSSGYGNYTELNNQIPAVNLSQYTFFKKNIILQNQIYYTSLMSLFGMDTDSKPLTNQMKSPSLNVLKKFSFLNSS